jgi:hypothetical protein
VICLYQRISDPGSFLFRSVADWIPVIVVREQQILQTPRNHLATHPLGARLIPETVVAGFHGRDRPTTGRMSI